MLPELCPEGAKARPRELSPCRSLEADGAPGLDREPVTSLESRSSARDEGRIFPPKWLLFDTLVILTIARAFCATCSPTLFVNDTETSS